MAWFVRRRLLDVRSRRVGSRRLFCAGILLVCPLALDASRATIVQTGSEGSTGSESLSESKRAVEQIIRAQIAAFSRDDSSAAFAFAAPSIQQRFGDPARFMEMVIGGYPMVYRPKSLEFGQFRMTSENTGVQRVEVSDSEATLWIAHYAVVRIDGEWRIAGVQIAATQSKVI